MYLHIAHSTNNVNSMCNKDNEYLHYNKSNTNNESSDLEYPFDPTPKNYTIEKLVFLS